MLDRTIYAGLTNEARKLADNYFNIATPTALDVRTGMPSQLEARTSAAKALKSIAQAIQKDILSIGEVHFRSAADRTLTPGAQLHLSAQHAKSKRGQRAQAIETALNQAQEKAASLRSAQKAYTQPSSNVGQAMLDMELLRMLREAKTEERMKLVGEPEFSAAVARAPIHMTGLDPDGYSRVRHEYLASVLPAETADLDDLNAAIRTSSKAWEALNEAAETLIDFKTAEAIEAGQLSKYDDPYKAAA